MISSGPVLSSPASTSTGAKGRLRVGARTLLGALLALCLVLSGCADDEEKVADFLDRGDVYSAEGKDDEAIIEYKNVLQIDPENARAHEALSMAYLRVEKPRESYWEMSETVRLAPSNLEARLRYGTISAAIGDYDLSLEQAEAVLAADPGNARALTLRAQARESREEFDGAEEDFKAAVASDADAPAFHFLLGGFYERRGRYEEAEQAYRELAKVEESYLGSTALARIVTRDDARRDELKTMLDRIVELAKVAPKEALETPKGTEDRGTVSLLHNVLREDAVRGAYTLKAMLIREEGDIEAAIAVLEEGVQASETKIEIIYQMANLYRAEGRSEDERRMIRRATTEAPDNANAQLVLSAYLAQQGDLDGALKAAQDAVAADADSLPAKLREAELLVDVGFRDGGTEAIKRGRKIVDDVLEAAPGSPEAHFVKAKIELAEDDLAAAKSSLETTLQARPNWGQARFVLGSALAAEGDLRRARVELESSIEAEPNLLDARKLLTQIYAQLGEHEFAIDQGRAYLRARPGDLTVRIVVGQSLIRVGRAEEAYTEISTIPEDQRDAASHFALGRLDLAYGRTEEGAAKLRRAEEMAPGNPQVLRSLLAIDRQQGNLDASIARIQKALEVDPKASEIVELDAEAKLLAGDPEAAKARLNEAVELEPRNVTAQLALADLAARSGDMAEMLLVIERAANAVPESSDLQFRLAQAYERNGKQKEAIDSYERAIVLNDDLALAKNNLAYLLVESKGDLDRALELAQQAKESLPDDGNAADTLGWVLLARDLPSAAIGYLEEAAERFPKDSFEVQGIVHNHLAEAYEQNNEASKAIAESKAAVEFYEKLSKIAGERGINFDEPDWSLQSKSRVVRLGASS